MRDAHLCGGCCRAVECASGDGGERARALAPLLSKEVAPSPWGVRGPLARARRGGAGIEGSARRESRARVPLRRPIRDRPRASAVSGLARPAKRAPRPTHPARSEYALLCLPSPTGHHPCAEVLGVLGQPPKFLAPIDAPLPGTARRDVQEDEAVESRQLAAVHDRQQ